jgi:3-phosphoshikimate 1-carboxyvinyltransferase
MAAFSDESDLFIEDLKKESIQGEKVLAEFFQQFGVETTFSEKGIRLTKIPFETKEFSFDFTNTPDLAIPAIVTCAGMNIPGKFTGINKERLKENSRIETLENELKKLGASLTYQNNSILLEPGTFSASELELEADNDHKLAMSFAPLSKKVQTLKLFSPGTVKKSYPHFWKDINNFGIRVTIPEGICS